MDEHGPKTQIMEAAEAQTRWGEILDRVSERHARVIVEKNGTPVAAVISTEDLERFERLEAEWDAPFAALDRTRAVFADIPDDELEREVAKAVAEAR